MEKILSQKMSTTEAGYLNQLKVKRLVTLCTNILLD